MTRPSSSRWPSMAALASVLVLVGCGAAELPVAPAPLPPASAHTPPPSPPGPRTRRPFAELESDRRCEGESLPCRFYFACGSADLADVHIRSGEAWNEMMDLIESDPSILAVRVYGTNSSRLEPHREDLGRARAEAIADAPAEPLGVATRAQFSSLGTDAQECTCDAPCERVAMLEVLRCLSLGRPPEPESRSATDEEDAK